MAALRFLRRRAAWLNSAELTSTQSSPVVRFPPIADVRDEPFPLTCWIMRRALDLSATAIIVVHNHPSGDPAPSQQDIRLTRDLAEAGRHLRVTLHDHIIVGASGHISLRSEGLI